MFLVIRSHINLDRNCDEGSQRATRPHGQFHSNWQTKCSKGMFKSTPKRQKSIVSWMQVHSELELEVPVEHGLLLENLLDLAHAPFTHTSTFAKGWPIPDVVKFNAARMLGGNWEPYPIDMSFEPPCMVLSTIGGSLLFDPKGTCFLDAHTLGRHGVAVHHCAGFPEPCILHILGEALRPAQSLLVHCSLISRRPRLQDSAQRHEYTCLPLCSR